MFGGHKPQASVAAERFVSQQKSRRALFFTNTDVRKAANVSSHPPFIIIKNE